VGTGLTVGLTAPIVAMGYKSVVAFDKQAKAIAQVEAGVNSTGKAAGFATDQLLKMASDLQNKTIFGDEEILQGVTSQLLTFTNIAGEQFERTQLAALNLSTRLDGDLKSASIQLGKALNDPVANLSALSRSGIQFSNEQKEVIKQLANTNRLADAQTIILNELENQYGGAAEAAAKAGTGPFKQLSNTLGDILEDFGKIISEALLPFISKLKDLADRFQLLDPSIKKTIVVVAALAAALGPVLAVMGVLVANIIPAMAAGLTALTGPIGLVIAALAGIAVVIYKNWEPIKKTLVDIRNYFTDLYNESVVFRVAIEQVILTFRTLYNVVKLVIDFIVSGFTNGIEFILGSVENLGKAFKAILTGDIKAIPAIFKEQGQLARTNFGGLIGDISKDIEFFTSSMKNDIGDAVDAVTKRKKITFSESNIDATAIQNAVANAVSNGKSVTGNSSVNLSTDIDQQISDSLKETDELKQLFIETGVNVDIAKQEAELQRYNSSLEESFDDWKNIGNEFNIVSDQMIERMERLREVGLVVGQEVGNAFANLSQIVVDSLGLASHGFEGFIKGLAQTVTKLISMMLASSISQAIAGATASGTATGPGAIFATPAFISTAVGGVLAAFASIPKFADGGIVSGPTLGLMGEYSGAKSNPEVIAPLNKLKGMISDVTGGGNMHVSGEFRLRDRDLVAAIDQAVQFKGRLG
ncbi:hypothetical protein ACNKXS_03640, partial [Christiangramia marina]|uniref:hypothetical protein n=1 Tax=Christiangramia marina TaxID=409436 RepID=UPI003AA8173E